MIDASAVYKSASSVLPCESEMSELENFTPRPVMPTMPTMIPAAAQDTATGTAPTMPSFSAFAICFQPIRVDLRSCATTIRSKIA